MTAFVFAEHYGANLPFYDEWHWVPYLTGDEPVTPGWLWSQHEEHRLVLPRLLYLALFELAQKTFRAVAFFNVVALGTLAFAMTWAAKRLRGRQSYADAFFPLVFLNLGAWDVFLWGFNIQTVSSTMLAGILLLIMVRSAPSPSFGKAILGGICLVLLPLCGANGLGLVPVLALWLGYVGALSWLSEKPHGRRNGLLILVLVGIALGEVPLYFIGFERGTSPPSQSFWRVLEAGAQFLSMSWGMAAERYWPVSGLVVAALLMISAAVLVWRGYRQPQERCRALGLFMFLSAFSCITLGIGWGRGGAAFSGVFMPRYVILAAPALCCVYFAWGIADSRAGRIVQIGLVLVMGLLSWENLTLARAEARNFRTGRAAFARDLAAGVPPFILVERHQPAIYPGDVPGYMKELATSMEKLHRAGVGEFRLLREDPVFREVRFPVEPTATSQMTWNAGIGHGIGERPSVLFTLKKPQMVYAIRLEYSYKRLPEAPADFRMYWKSKGRDFVETERVAQRELDPRDGDEVLTVWVNDIIDQFRVDPDRKPCVFQLSDIQVLVPPTGPLDFLPDEPATGGHGGQPDAGSEFEPIYPLGRRVDFTQTSCRRYFHLSGWYGPEPTYRWSGREASLRFRLAQVMPLRLRLLAHTFGPQRIAVRLNGQDVGTLHGRGEALERMELLLPVDRLAESNTLSFVLPDARSPKSLGENEDERVLGLGMVWVQLTP
jgi:hypothetical protein